MPFETQGKPALPLKTHRRPVALTSRRRIVFVEATLRRHLAFRLSGRFLTHSNQFTKKYFTKINPAPPITWPDSPAFERILRKSCVLCSPRREPRPLYSLNDSKLFAMRPTSSVAPVYPESRRAPCRRFSLRSEHPPCARKHFRFRTYKCV